MEPSEEDPNAERNIDLAKMPAKVEKVHIDGLQRTKNDIVVKQVNSLFKADNFKDMVKTAEQTRLLMEQMGLFRRVKISVDTSKGPDARLDGYDITYKVKETRRVSGGVSTLVGTNDGTLMFQLRLPNAFGRAERLSAEYSYGTKSNVGYAVNFMKPLNGNPSTTLQTSFFQYSGDYPWSGYKQVDRGTAVSLACPSLVGLHSLSWEGVWRDLSCLTNTTSLAVREESGHSLKSSVKHVVTRDRRDNSVLPNNGYLLKLTQELAGLGGDAKFLKHDLEFQISKSLFLDTVIQLSVAGGVIQSFQPDGNLRINDRFFLGGPLTLRGFNFKGVGPHAEGNALGADTYCLAGLHMYTPLPFRPGRGGFGELFRTHFFINAGNMRNVNLAELGDHWRETAHKYGETMRVAYGAGIVLRMGEMARMELNYCVPLRYQKGDRTNPGLQFGIGINFL